MANSEAEKFADKMGEAAKQLAQGLIKLMKIMEKMEAEKLNQQAKVDGDFGKMLKDSGFEASKGNIEMLKGHQEKLQTVQQKLNEQDTQISKIEGLKQTPEEKSLLEKRDELGGKREEVGKKYEGVNAKRDELVSKGPDFSPEQQKELDGMDKELSTMKGEIEGLDKETLEVDDKLQSIGKDKMEKLSPDDKKLVADRDATGLELDGLKSGKGLEGLKPDGLKQALDGVKPGSTLATLKEQGSSIGKVGPGFGPAEGIAANVAKIGGPK